MHEFILCTIFNKKIKELNCSQNIINSYFHLNRTWKLSIKSWKSSYLTSFLVIKKKRQMNKTKEIRGIKIEALRIF